MLVRRSNQLSCETTDDERCSFVASNVPVMNESMKAMILPVRKAMFCNCVEKPEKFRTSSRHIIAFIYNDLSF